MEEQEAGEKDVEDRERRHSYGNDSEMKVKGNIRLRASVCAWCYVSYTNFITFPGNFGQLR